MEWNSSARIAELEAENAALRARVEELEAEATDLAFDLLETVG